METLLYPLSLQFRAATRQFRDALGDLSSEHALTRINGTTNHAAYIALHVLDARCYVIRLLGGECSHGFEAASEGARGVEDIEEYPSLAEILDSWDRVSEILMRQLESADETALAAEPPFRFPVDDETVLGAVSFLAHHEGYHLGQLGLIRKALGLSSLPFRAPESDPA
ncbi:MAG: DinB family protein [Gemmatimonadota bacterium]|jgi:hypothetical protein